VPDGFSDVSGSQEENVKPNLLGWATFSKRFRKQKIRPFLLMPILPTGIFSSPLSPENPITCIIIILAIYGLAFFLFLRNRKTKTPGQDKLFLKKQ